MFRDVNAVNADGQSASPGSARMIKALALCRAALYMALQLPVPSQATNATDQATPKRYRKLLLSKKDRAAITAGKRQKCANKV